MFRFFTDLKKLLLIDVLLLAVPACMSIVFCNALKAHISEILAYIIISVTICGVVRIHAALVQPKSKKYRFLATLMQHSGIFSIMACMGILELVREGQSAPMFDERASYVFDSVFLISVIINLGVLLLRVCKLNINKDDFWFFLVFKKKR
jgi:hypothetical protein